MNSEIGQFMLQLNHFTNMKVNLQVKVVAQFALQFDLVIYYQSSSTEAADNLKTENKSS